MAFAGESHHQRVAVRLRSCDDFGADIARGARPILNDEWLTKPIHQPLTDQARDDVRRATGRNGHDQSHRPRRIGLRACISHDGRQRGSSRSQMQKFPAGKFHGGPTIAEKATPVPFPLPLLPKRLAGPDHVRKGRDVRYWPSRTSASISCCGSEAG